MNQTILGTLPFIWAAALTDTQDFSFDEIYHRTVEAINWDMVEHAWTDQFSPLEGQMYEDFSCSPP